MNNNIFIPKKCKVGFQERSDTYTGKLGYIIAQENNKWRKEPSWESWRSKFIPEEENQKNKELEYKKKLSDRIKGYESIQNGKPNKGYYEKYEKMTLEEYLIEYGVNSIDEYRYSMGNFSTDITINPIEFDNTPMEGFVLNKRVGGYKSGWNHRGTYCRVYHPLGFEFEITIENLLYVLDNTSSIKGKGLEGNCILGWNGKDLVLIPEEAPEFQEMIAFTERRDLKLIKKDLIVGGMYYTKSGEILTYMGESIEYKFDYNKKISKDRYEKISNGKKLWFMDSYYSSYFNKDIYSYYTKNTNTLTEFINIDPDYNNKQKELLQHTYYNFET